MKTLRRIVIPVLKWTAFDFDLRHHWVPTAKFKLNSFRHKGYWYTGKKREQATMELFARLIEPEMTVAEVGGHIGYISIYFSHLVGPEGKVVVFEPGLNNLPYTAANLGGLPNIKLEKMGLAQNEGTLTFIEESLTGQNNTFAADFEGLEANQQAAHVSININRRDVKVTTLDAYFPDKPPDFIKIDVEGFEKEVLLGGLELLKKKPMLMVEIQSHRSEIFELLQKRGYILFNDKAQVIKSADQLKYNTFCLHKTEHRSKLESLNISAS